MSRAISVGVIAILAVGLSACVPVREAATERPKTLQQAGFGKAHSEAAPELQQFGRFAGRWDCAMSELTGTNEWRMRPSGISWTWFYTLDGRAVQDIWTAQIPGADGQVIATNLRLFDASAQQWNVAWTNTRQAYFELWTGAATGDDMVLTSVREQRPVRIRFYEIMPRRFKWIYEASPTTAAAGYVAVLQMNCQKLD